MRAQEQGAPHQASHLRVPVIMPGYVSLGLSADLESRLGPNRVLASSVHNVVASVFGCYLALGC